eukprot:Platyproteum_vivax@DN411_c0_g1_i1.p1
MQYCRFLFCSLESRAARGLFQAKHVAPFWTTSTPKHKFTSHAQNLIISVEVSPNELARSFWPKGRTLNQNGKTSSFNRKDKVSYKDTLVSRLLKHECVQNIMLAEEFITVTVEDPYDWEIIENVIKFEIKRCFIEGLELMPPPAKKSEEESDAEVVDEDETEVVEMIKALLETRIRPFVTNDGGDVSFVRFDHNTGTVYLRLWGACRGCPSSTDTLYGGIQGMLHHYVPEVVNVKQVDEHGDVVENEFEE